MIILNNSSSRLLRFLVIILLIFAIVFCSAAGQYAHALVLESALFAVVATILIGSGVIASSDADLDAVVSDFYNSLDTDAVAAIGSIASRYADATGNFAFNVSQVIVNAVSDWLAAKEWSSFDDAGVGGFTVAGGSQAIFQGIDFSSIYNSDLTGTEFQTIYTKYGSWSAANEACNIPSSSISDSLLNKVFYCRNFSGTDHYWKIVKSDGIYSLWGCKQDGTFISSYGTLYYISVFSSSGYSNPKEPYIIWMSCEFSGMSNWMPLEYSGSTGSVTTFPQSNVQSNTTYFPQEVVSSAAGSSTEFPVNTASEPLTTDLPLTIPADGVNSNTGASDVRVPATDVPDVPATGTWETLWDWLGSIGDSIAGIPAAIGSVFADFFDPSGFSLDFSAFNFDLTEIFPFCIPFDFVDGIKTLAADSAGFKFDIKLETSYFEIDHTVDLAPFRIPILFFRFIVDFWFAFILISRTRDFIKW